MAESPMAAGKRACTLLLQQRWMNTAFRRRADAMSPMGHLRPLRHTDAGSRSAFEGGPTSGAALDCRLADILRSAAARRVPTLRRCRIDVFGQQQHGRVNIEPLAAGSVSGILTNAFHTTGLKVFGTRARATLHSIRPKCCDGFR
jgi:hypothetical protein